MTLRDETPFTRRMRQSVNDCRKLKPPYNASYFQKMLDDCGGDFANTARAMLHDQNLHDGLVKLADLGRLHLSMEWIIAHEDEWHGIFDEEDRIRARERLRLAEGLRNR